MQKCRNNKKNAYTAVIMKKLYDKFSAWDWISDNYVANGDLIGGKLLTQY